ncbi:hypothetical protein CCR97_08600 [Rhodoplanes elegans]|uniref:DUF5076 domain-containing protein n=1 Tax=Rhodoplanes elegans TaxID=29408 RepID=A0A327KXC3_9BRAD|nr:DUF5076 domain-containing protein [Rhodoplanes elegans]MBK5958269.1 hypothetical protein [Rhodoplanes elegans]RAI40018.1 hypothetical protein CH338_07470 [Rhodoplanes elegans]
MARSKTDDLYHALPIAEDALANGGVEILRAGLIDDELFVTARHAFDDPATWGEVLAEITRKLAQIYSLETDLTEAEALAEIEEAYAADLGAKEVDDTPPPRPATSRKSPARKAAAAPAGKRAPAKPATAKKTPTKKPAAGKSVAAKATKIPAKTTANSKPVAKKPAPRARPR